MARSASIIAASLVAAGLTLASIVATGTVAAKHGSDDPSPSTSPSASAGPSASASRGETRGRSQGAGVTASVSSAPQGGSIKVKVRVAHAAKSAVFSARATATFATGRTTLELRRSGKSFVAVGRMPVPTTQHAGPVSVTILVRYADSTTTITRVVLIRPAGDDDASPVPSLVAAPSPSAIP